MDNALARLGTNSTYTSYGGNNMTGVAKSPDSDANSQLVVPGTDRENALCNTCPNSVGICCPPTVECDGDDGKCPLYALENSHNTLNGYLIAQVMNSSAPVAGRKKVRALPKPKNDVTRAKDQQERGKSAKKAHLAKKAHRRRF
ncbi:hypothetical protein A1O3_10421 [Capronia epimyces CBS 606.96]|uniref:Uncharacterized protein n=1 Tax=Capronia epimyces CBS 606.96 TaxID=1182542 RepID=W9XAI8_9EURO|nr:uncharacterized protein A1O3_10421 [Capronia epimyces CBS 606.96]EXJ77263.1 hypothetical protein A1O3_10421 [Capronia epimyces CBS 606.96]